MDHYMSAQERHEEYIQEKRLMNFPADKMELEAYLSARGDDFPENSDKLHENDIKLLLAHGRITEEESKEWFRIYGS